YFCNPVKIKRSTIQSLTMVVGLLIAVLIVVVQPSLNDLSERHEVATEQTESENEATAVISLPSFSLPAPVSLGSCFDGQFLFEILFEETEHDTEVPGTDLFQKLFVTLFRVIISPNAP